MHTEPPPYEHAALRFLIAARQCELAELVELTRTVDLLQAVGALVHELQRERGLSNLTLGSGADEHRQALQAQRRHTDGATGTTLAMLQRLDPALTTPVPGSRGARLYGRVAHALQAHAALAALRRGIEEGRSTVAQSTEAHTRLVSAWLGVVFEAAEVAGDAEMARLLVALFSLLQAKELAGQERAAGSALFAQAGLDDEQRDRVHELVESQVQHIAQFTDFATPAALQAWQEWLDDARGEVRARLRRWLLEPSAHGALNPALGRPWFDACTLWLDAMKGVQDRLLADLRALAGSKAARIEQELSTLEQVNAALPAQAVQAEWRGPTAWALEGQSHPSILDLVHEQARRLQTLGAELDAARAALQERRLIERAKGVLMASSGLSEEAAHQALRQMAMGQGRRMVEVAEALLRRTK